MHPLWSCSNTRPKDPKRDNAFSLPPSLADALFPVGNTVLSHIWNGTFLRNKLNNADPFNVVDIPRYVPHLRRPTELKSVQKSVWSVTTLFRSNKGESKLNFQIKSYKWPTNICMMPFRSYYMKVSVISTFIISEDLVELFHQKISPDRPLDRIISSL